MHSNDAFLRLQTELSDTETRVALARSYYNEIATGFNTRLGTLPDGLIAKLGLMRGATLITAEDFERPAIEIELTEEASA